MRWSPLNVMWLSGPFLSTRETQARPAHIHRVTLLAVLVERELFRVERSTVEEADPVQRVLHEAARHITYTPARVVNQDAYVATDTFTTGQHELLHDMSAQAWESLRSDDRLNNFICSAVVHGPARLPFHISDELFTLDHVRIVNQVTVCGV